MNRRDFLKMAPAVAAGTVVVASVVPAETTGEKFARLEGQVSRDVAIEYIPPVELYIPPEAFISHEAHVEYINAFNRRNNRRWS